MPPPSVVFASGLVFALDAGAKPRHVPSFRSVYSLLFPPEQTWTTGRGTATRIALVSFGRDVWFIVVVVVVITIIFLDYQR